MMQQSDRAWHMLPSDEVLAALGTRAKGLSRDEAETGQNTQQQLLTPESCKEADSIEIARPSPWCCQKCESGSHCWAGLKNPRAPEEQRL